MAPVYGASKHPRRGRLRSGRPSGRNDTEISRRVHGRQCSRAAVIDRQFPLGAVGRAICLGSQTVLMTVELPDTQDAMDSLIVCQGKIVVAVMARAIEIPVSGHAAEDKYVLVFVLAEDEEFAVWIHPATRIHRNSNNCRRIVV